MKKAVKLIVYGLVQGVGLRYNIYREAQQLKLTGYVQNLPDGTVGAVAEGTEEKLKSFIDWLKASPGASQVEKVKEDWSQKDSNYQDFTIHY